ncbi:unnamed protein product, partial [Musa acuminata subsp. burmannicoides]
WIVEKSSNGVQLRRIQMLQEQNGNGIGSNLTASSTLVLTSSHSLPKSNPLIAVSVHDSQ